MCSEVRGSVSYLFGLRVAEEARGKGVASHVMVRERGRGRYRGWWFGGGWVSWGVGAMSCRYVCGGDTRIQRA